MNEKRMLFPPGSRPELNTEIVIGETDYSSYAILYYQKRGKITMKLYGGFLIQVTPVWSKSRLGLVQDLNKQFDLH